MTALPLSLDRKRAAPSGAAAFARRLDGNVRHYLRLWDEAPSSLSEEHPEAGPILRCWRRVRTARRARRLIDDLGVSIADYPSDGEERDRWRTDLQERVRRFGARHLGWPEGYRELLVAEDFWRSTVEFTRAAHEFAPRIAPEDLFQALRNVWIINSVQMLLDQLVRCTTASYAYSMLYPWTDNLLDSSEVSDAHKRDFNRRLGDRLRGEPIPSSSEHEDQVFRLVGAIEVSLPRADHPAVYFALQAIHAGQVASLSQQRAGSTEEALLEVTVRKGGSSLLPDGYLVDPDLDAERERFLFGYGVFLQLLDDLQDVSSDLAAGHETLFTVAARRGRLDRETAKLGHLIDACLDAPGPFSDRAFDDRRDLIRRNCRALLVGAVAEERKRFSWGFRRRFARSWPITLRASRRLRSYASRELGAAVRALEEARGGSSLVDLLRDETV